MGTTIGLFALWELETSAVDTKAAEAVMLWIFSVVQIKVSTEITNSCPTETKQGKRSSREGLDDIRTFCHIIIPVFWPKE